MSHVLVTDVSFRSLFPIVVCACETAQKPAYTTIATFLKILEQKGFVERRKGNAGKQLVYTPLMTKERYCRQVMDDVKKTFFDGSVASLVSFFAEEDELSQEDINEILAILKSRNPEQ